METLKEMDTLASELLKKLPELIEQGTIYGSDLFNRYVSFELLSSSLTIIFSLIGIVFSIFSLKKSIKTDYSYKSDDSEVLGVFCGIIGGGVMIASLTALIRTSHDMIKILTIPEIVIIEKFIN